MTRVSAQLG